MRPYFAYGSNMRNEQMKERCNDHRKVGRAILPGYRWLISKRGYATVVKSPEDEVEGVLFEISEADEASLDRHEGVCGGSYIKEEVEVTVGARRVVALIYVDPVTVEGSPKDEYVRRINSGLADAGLSEAYVSRHVRKFVPHEY